MKQQRSGRRSTAKKLSPATILVVEDNPITSKLVQVTLQKEGYLAVTAPDGKTALEYAARQMPDLILQDLKLPDIDGIELVRKLRALPGGDGIPILAFTGFVTKVEEGIIANVGFTDFLIKPVEPSQLITVIRTYLLPSQALTERPGQGRRLLLVDDDPILLKYGSLQFTNAGFEVIPVHSGKDALDQARKQPPDIIVSDVLMPGMDGYQICYAARQDPALRKVPVVLMSSNYVEEADHKLAERIGASAYVHRGLGVKEILNAVVDSLSRKAPVPTIRTGEEFEQERHARIIWQLDRIVTLRTGAVQRSYTQAAILNELSLISETLIERRDIESALEGILAHCLDGAGLSKGMLFLVDEQDQLKLHAQYGCAKIIPASRNLFNQPDLFAEFVRAEYPISVPSPALPAKASKSLLTQTESESALMIPIPKTEGSRGLLALFSTSLNLVEEDWVAFGRSLALQIGQTIALSQAILKLANSEQRYRIVTQATNDVIWDWNLDTNALWWNENFQSVFGYQTSEIEPGLESWTQRLHPDDLERVVSGIHKVIESGGKLWSDEYRFRRADGAYAHIYDRGFVTHDAAGKPVRMMGAMADITQRKQTEVHLQRRLEQQAAVARLGQFALVKQNSEMVEAEAVALIARTLNVELAKVLVKLPESDELLLRAGIGWRAGLVGHATVATGRKSQAGYTLSSKKSVIVEDLSRETRFKGPPLLTDHAVVSGISVIIGHSDDPIGVLGAHTTKRRKFTDEDVHFIEAIANILAESHLRAEQEQLLAKTEQRSTYLINSSPSVIYATMVEKPHRCNFVSDTLIKLTDARPEQMQNDPKFWISHVHPEDIQRVLTEIEDHINTGHGTVEYRFRDGSGEYRWIRDSMRVIHSKDGKPVEIVGSWSDITEFKQAEQKIRKQLEHLNLLDQITRAIGERQDVHSICQAALSRMENALHIDFGSLCVYDRPDSVMLLASVSASNFAGLDMQGQPRLDIDKNGLNRCLQGQLIYEPDISQSQFPFTRSLASCGLRSLVMAPLQVKGNTFGMLITARGNNQGFSSIECEFLRQLCDHIALAMQQAQLYDALQSSYEDLRQSQQAVMQQERLRAIGQMASGMAHDINNALSPVALFTESLLETEQNLSAKAREHLEIIQRAVDDVAQTIERMRDFYRQGESQVTLMPVQVNHLVEEVLSLCRTRYEMPQQYGIVIEARTELAPGLPDIMGIESEIRETLVNLVFNAVDALPAGGTFIIRTNTTPRPDEPAPAAVVIEVADTGLGMDEDTRQRCLEPFFTTKGERGTGLGLAMVYGMIQRHTGEIEIDSAPGAGTTVRLIFPVATTGLEESAQSLTHPVPSGLRLLLVDDDSLLLKSMQHILEIDGHVIVPASDGQKGIDSFLDAIKQGTPFDAVITDLGMPHIDGRRVAAAVKQASPTTPVILLTGWGQRMLAENEVPPDVDYVISKPPKLQQLRNMLAICCGSAHTKPTA